MKDKDKTGSDKVSDFDRPVDDLVSEDWVSEEGIEHTDEVANVDFDSIEEEDDETDTPVPPGEDEVSDFERPINDLIDEDWVSDEGVEETDQV